MLDITRPGISAGEWSEMSVVERISRCRAFAREAQQLAQAAHPDMKRRYLDIAAQWTTLAGEIEDAGNR